VWCDARNSSSGVSSYRTVFEWDEALKGSFSWTMTITACWLFPLSLIYSAGARALWLAIKAFISSALIRYWTMRRIGRAPHAHCASGGARFLASAWDKSEKRADLETMNLVEWSDRVQIRWFSRKRLKQTTLELN